jgi:replication factor A2
MFSGSWALLTRFRTSQGSYNDETLRPVTIKQLLDVEEAYPQAELFIDGANLNHTQLTVVGQVRAVNPQATNITYRLDDGTGQIDVKKWVDAEKQDDTEPKFELDSYVRVWGRLKIFNGRKHLGAHFMRAVDDFNEVNYHMLEVTYVHLYATKGPVLPDGGGAAGGGGDSMFVDGGYAGGGNESKVSQCSPAAQKIFNYLMNQPNHDGNGISVHQVTAGTNLPVSSIMTAAEELLSQGLIYTTVDDQSWAILDYA